jgi:squalene cyclase
VIFQGDFARSGFAPENKPTPEERALAYLAREVPRWARENRCYSCHNNGDAARALYTAMPLSYRIPEEALKDTTHWLARPRQWEKNGGKAGVSDKGLARIQFAAALVAAFDARQLDNRQALREAAELIARDQRPDGSWQLEGEAALGSPATYGSCLATYQARRVLQRADAKRFQPALGKADDWLRQVRVKSVLDAAAVILATRANDDRAVAQRKHCLALIRKGESADGGWGPYVTSAPESFDTAVVLLAIAEDGDEQTKQLLHRGRAFLVAKQQEDGSWPETTRPAGAESYAQRLSTTGWATLALLAVRDRPH